MRVQHYKKLISNSRRYMNNPYKLKFHLNLQDEMHIAQISDITDQIKRLKKQIWE